MKQYISMPIVSHLLVTLQPNTALDFTSDPRHNHRSEFHTLIPWENIISGKHYLSCYMHNTNRVLHFWFNLYIVRRYIYTDVGTLWISFIPNLIHLRNLNKLTVGSWQTSPFQLRTGKHYWILAATAPDCVCSLPLAVFWEVKRKGSVHTWRWLADKNDWAFYTSFWWQDFS